MKVLSIKQPFAELILQGRKTIEIRKWNTSFRGEFLIHASKHALKEYMEKYGINRELSMGQIIGKAELVEVKEYHSEKEFEEDKDKHLASKEIGKYGFVLRNVVRVHPIKCRGFLNFWDYTGKVEEL